MAVSAAEIQSASNIAWVSGELFDGYLVMKLVPPDEKAFCVFEDSGERASSRYVVPIEAGVLDSDVKVPFNSAVTPTNSQYRAFWVDKALNLIANGAGFITVTADPHTITPETLTDPLVEGTLPALDFDAEGAAAQPGIVKETLSGTKDGANTAFTVSKDTTITMVFLNGQLMLEGTGYSKSGTAITAIAPYIPQTGDSYEALLI